MDIYYKGASVYSYRSMTFIIVVTCCFYTGSKGRTLSKYYSFTTPLTSSNNSLNLHNIARVDPHLVVLSFIKASSFLPWAFLYSFKQCMWLGELLKCPTILDTTFLYLFTYYTLLFTSVTPKQVTWQKQGIRI